MLPAKYSRACGSADAIDEERVLARAEWFPIAKIFVRGNTQNRG